MFLEDYLEAIEEVLSVLNPYSICFDKLIVGYKSLIFRTSIPDVWYVYYTDTGRIEKVVGKVYWEAQVTVLRDKKV